MNGEDDTASAVVGALELALAAAFFALACETAFWAAVETQWCVCGLSCCVR